MSTRHCQNCPEKIEANTRFCGGCGRPVGDPPVAPLTPEIVRKMSQRGADYYAAAFARMFPTGAVTLKPGWNWAAALGGPFWLLYRGLFLETAAILAFDLLLNRLHLPLWPLQMIAQGIFGNAIYFLALERRAQRKAIAAT
jgi:hypothetical protein